MLVGGGGEFFIMFKDATNATATYGSRMLGAHAVANGRFTVLDFNLAGNPPCAYSPYTNLSDSAARESAGGRDRSGGETLSDKQRVPVRVSVCCTTTMLRGS